MFHRFRPYDRISPMAKKTKSNKKHRFKYAEPTGGSELTQAAVQVPMATTAAPAKGTVAAPTVASRDFTYVSVDVRRLSVFAVGLVALELLLWFTFTHTGVGDAVFNLVHV